MIPSPFESSDWYRAVTLAERIRSLRPSHRRAATTSPAEGGAAGEPDLDRARLLLDRWRSQNPFQAPARFKQRLARDRLTEADFIRLLGESADSVRARLTASPAWLEELAAAYSQPSTPAPVETEVALPGQAPDLSGFLCAIEPLIERARRRVSQGIGRLCRTHRARPFDPDTVLTLLLTSLPTQLIARLSRTMVLELNVARLEGFLTGDTPEDRYRSFVTRLQSRDAALAILSEYPVLARQVVTYLERWACFATEFLGHLCADWDDLRRAFGLGEESVLSGLSGNAGDQHRGGRSVLILELGRSKLVYKPRSLSADIHFQQLLKWLNQRGDHPPFRTLEILDRGSHGWVEFVEAGTCNSEEEVRRFYERQGGYLALLYALQATDFHFENLIASGEHPVLIDLESILQPRLAPTDQGDSDFVAVNLMGQSVLRVGMLPQRLWGEGESEGVDISGLASVAGQLTPRGVPFWESPGTDEMRFSRRRMPIPGKDNRPTLDGREVELLGYVDEIVTGLTKVYRLLERERGALLRAGGPIDQFAGDEIRVILRPTRSYGLLLSESFHPDFLRDGLDRDRFFDRLWVGTDGRPYLVRAIAAEREDLHQGDIPMFWTRPGSKDLWSSSNRRFAGFFPQAGVERVHTLMTELGEEDLARQVWFIRASLATLGSHADRAARPVSETRAPRSEPARGELLAAARKVGERLESLALRSRGEANWIGLSLVDARRWVLLPLGMDLYSGLPGVALFLAYLGSITGEARHTELAREALATLRRYVDLSRSSFDVIGAFGGWGGLIWTQAQIAGLWESAEWLDRAEEAVRDAREAIPRDDRLDVIGGAAGLIGALLSLHHLSPRDSTLEAAVQCGERLIDRAARAGPGLAWTTSIPARQPLCGFSHGVAGIAWSLARLTGATGDERFRRTALDGLAYERSCFSTTAKNWPDFRDFKALGQDERVVGDGFMANWCHGASGIGLGRLNALEHIDDAECRSEIRTAVMTTIERGFGTSHCLCHGDLGNLELLLQASDLLDEPSGRIDAGRIASDVLAGITTQGWQCGIPLQVESPGLMTGLAGIGLGLLRLAEPQRVPSVLTLDPPRIGAASEPQTLTR